MRALLLDYSRRSLSVGDYSMPSAPRAGEALVRVIEGGVCGTDRNLASFIYGKPPGDEPALILGHEALGIVEHSNDPSLTKGQLVVPMIRRDCAPACGMCARGRRDNCLTGRYTERGIAGAHGYFAEFAVDAACDLIPIDARLADVGVLVEPMSVAEKTFDVVGKLHQGEPRSVLILGAGTIGILCAWAALLRGFEVTVMSTEPADSARARLLKSFGVRYTQSLDGLRADVIIEACGAAAVAAASLRCLNNCGVQMILGARAASVEIPYLEMILGNKIIAGSVNASRAHFESAAASVGRLERAQLSPLIERRALAEAPSTVMTPPPNVIKLVHVVSS